MLIIWTFLCELPEILTLVSTCSCFKPVVAYFKRNFMRVNFIGSSHIYYHKSNYLSLTTILTHRDHLKPYAYLTYILDELRKMGAFPKEEELKKLLPWSEDLPEYCRTKLKK